MTYKCFNVEIAGNIAHLQLKRGERANSMIPEFWTELPEIITDINAGAKARVIVISSTGKHFCSGMDLSVFSDGQAPEKKATDAKEERGRRRAGVRESILDLQDTFNVLEQARMPVLAAVQGGCIGGAVDFISACDCRYATEDAFFLIQEINLAITADVGTFPRLTKLIPEGMVRELAYAGRRLPAKKALQLGLVNELFPTQEAMLDHVMGLAKDIAEKSPLAVYGSKVVMNYGRDHTVADTLEYIATWQAGMYYPETDLAEAAAARSEKRTPKFDDLPPVRRGLGGI